MKTLSCCFAYAALSGIFFSQPPVLAQGKRVAENCAIEKVAQSKSVVVYVGMRRRGSREGWKSVMIAAAGNKNTFAHQLDVKIVLKFRDGAPVVGRVLRDPVITKGGRGPKDNKPPTAFVRLARVGSRVVPSNNKGEVFGVFTSGHRTETTEFQVDAGSQSEKTIGFVHQRGNEMTVEQRWPLAGNPANFVYGAPVPVIADKRLSATQ